MHRRRRCSELPLRPSVSLRRSLWLVDPAAPHLVNGPAPRIPKGVHRQAVGFKASLDHTVIIWGQQCGLAAIRLCHDIGHDWELSASRVFNSHRFFRVVAWIPLIPVQRLFTVWRELPQQSVDSIAFPGRHRSKAAAAFVSASASRIRRPMASMTLAVTLLPACLYACASDWMARMRSICP